MLHLQRVASVSSWAVVGARLLSIILGLGLSAASFSYFGYDVPQLVGKIGQDSLSNEFGLQDLGLLTSPLILTGLAVAVMLRAGLWNIGAEGQFYAGAIAATIAGLYIHGEPAVMLVVMGAAGFVGGAAWIAIPALARAYLEIDEIITTLLLNFVAILLVNYLCTGWLQDRAQAALTATIRVPYEMPMLWGDLHWGAGLAVLLVIVFAIIFAYTRWGYEVRVVGTNRHAAVYAGIPVHRRLLEVMLISGGIAGIAGMLEIAGTVHRLQGGISNNFGYLGIMVAVIAGGMPMAVLPASVLIALILDAGIVLQSYGVSAYEVLALTGALMLCIATGEQLAHYRVQWKNREVRQ
jgi:general nucleoside transport system permease protein